MPCRLAANENASHPPPRRLPLPCRRARGEGADSTAAPRAAQEGRSRAWSVRRHRLSGWPNPPSRHPPTHLPTVPARARAAPPPLEAGGPRLGRTRRMTREGRASAGGRAERRGARLGGGWTRRRTRRGLYHTPRPNSRTKRARIVSPPRVDRAHIFHHACAPPFTLHSPRVTGLRAAFVPFPPPPLVLSGHAASLTPY